MDTPLAEAPLNKTQELEAGDANLEEESAKLILCETSSGIRNDCGSKIGYMQMSDSHPVQRPRFSSTTRNRGCGGKDGNLVGCLSSCSRNEQSLNILQSMDQSIVILDRNGLVAFWNQFSEHLYGYSASEMLGRSTLGPIIEECDFDVANEIIRRCISGECWIGQFPVRNKQGRRFQIIATHTPLYNDLGTLVGVICATCDSQPFLEISPFSAGLINLSPEAAYRSCIGPSKVSLTTTTGLAPQEKPLEVVAASNLPVLTSRMTKSARANMTTGEKPESQGIDWPYIGHCDSIETVGSDDREDSLEEMSLGN